MQVIDEEIAAERARKNVLEKNLQIVPSDKSYGKRTETENRTKTRRNKPERDDADHDSNGMRIL